MIEDDLLSPGMKGFPLRHAPIQRSAVAAAGWNVLAGDLPMPIPVLKREAIEHNLAWMQQRVRDWGIDLAPHGKTTMSPQLFGRQLAAGAWGLTFATVTQLSIGVAAGARHTLIANQVFGDADLAGIQSLLAEHAGLRVVFLVDSLAQLRLIEAWFAAHPGSVPFEAMLEIGVAGGRTGCRTHAQALELARAVHAGAATRLVGIECYEGPGRHGRQRRPTRAYALATLMDRVDAVAREAADRDGWFDCRRGPDLGRRLGHLRPGRRAPRSSSLGAAGARPVALGLLRHPRSRHLQANASRRVMDTRLHCGGTARVCGRRWKCGPRCSHGPNPAWRSSRWARRDISFDLSSCRCRSQRAAMGQRAGQRAGAARAGTGDSALNDQHGYLRWDAGRRSARAGRRRARRLRHLASRAPPSTSGAGCRWWTNAYRVVDAVITTQF